MMILKTRPVFATLSAQEMELLWTLLSGHTEDLIVHTELDNPEATPEYKLASALLVRIEIAGLSG